MLSLLLETVKSVSRPPAARLLPQNVGRIIFKPFLPKHVAVLLQASRTMRDDKREEPGNYSETRSPHSKLPVFS